MKTIHWGIPDSDDVFLPACDHGLLSAYGLIVPASEFAQHVGAANMCQHCAELAKFQADKLKQQAETKTRTDSERYAELRALVEDTQREAMDPASSLVVFDNALRLLLDWKHR